MVADGEEHDVEGRGGRRTLALGGANVKDKRAVFAAEQAAAEAELARRIEAEAEAEYALRAEAQRMQAEREQAAHAEAEKAAMLEFAEAIGTTARFEGEEGDHTTSDDDDDDDVAAESGLDKSPPWKMTQLEPGANRALQTDQLARELSAEVEGLRGRLEKHSPQQHGSRSKMMRPASAAAPTPSMSGPRLEMICDDLQALPHAPPTCPAGYRLRTFKPGDEEGWCACFAQWTAGPHEPYTAAGWTPERLARWCAMDAGRSGGSGIKSPSEDLFVIETTEGKIVATACVWTTPSATKKTLVERNGAKVVLAMPSTGEINWVASVEGHRGKGLGDVVSLAVLQRLREIGKQSCWLETDDWRIPAIKTYIKYGFRKIITHDSHAARWAMVEKICRSGEQAPNLAPQLL